MPQPADGPDLLARCQASGQPVRMLHAHEPDALEAAGWSEVLDEALSGEIAFAGGALRLSPTPAMTLFDVDGPGATAALAVAAATAAAEAIVRLDIGGSIGIDFPDRDRQGRAPGGGRGDRRGAPATVRTHRAQRLRLSPDRPPPPPRLAPRTAPRRSGRNAGTGPAPPDRAHPAAGARRARRAAARRLPGSTAIPI